MLASGVLAAALVKPGKYEISEYPLSEPAARGVQTCMEMSGICGTEKHTFQGCTAQHGGRQLKFPIIQRHENVGTIAAIGGNGKYAEFERANVMIESAGVELPLLGCGGAQCFDSQSGSLAS